MNIEIEAMKYKPMDILRWDGGDGILKARQEYLVLQTRKGRREQEFTLKHMDGLIVKPIIWFETGPPFVKPYIKPQEAIDGSR
jgi:hypothetical protein